MISYIAVPLTVTLSVLSTDATPAPSPGSSGSTITDPKWAVLSLIITSVVAPLVVYIINKYAVRPPSTPSTPEQQASAPVNATPAPAPQMTPYGTMTAGASYLPDPMMDMMTGVWNRLQVLEDREDKWEKERKEIIKHNTVLMKTNSDLAIGLNTIVEWIDKGAQPPPPEVSIEIRHIIKQIVDRVNRESGVSKSSDSDRPPTI